MDKRVAVLFGGRSIEHEISVITGLQLIEALDVTRHSLVPVYVDQEGVWWTGDALLDRRIYPQMAAQASPGSGVGYGLHEVTLLPKPGVGGLLRLDTQEVLPVDIFILAFHGQNGEDGCVQGLMELADVPYTGCGVLSSALAMHKGHCKRILRDAGIPTLPFLQVDREEARQDFAGLRQRILSSSTLGEDSFPLFIKPVHLGSSLGVSRADDQAGLDAALAKAFMIDRYALVEPCISDLLEVNCAVLGGGEAEAQASVVEVPVASGAVLSYEDKYLRGGGSKGKGSQLGEVGAEGMAGLTRVLDPSDLDPELKRTVREISLKAFHLLDCRGVVRFDFMYDLKSESLYFNELNVIPGSFSYYLWDFQSNEEGGSAGLLYTELIDRLIQQAEHEYVMRGQTERKRSFVALCRA